MAPPARLRLRLGLGTSRNPNFPPAPSTAPRVADAYLYISAIPRFAAAAAASLDVSRDLRLCHRAVSYVFSMRDADWVVSTQCMFRVVLT